MDKSILIVDDDDAIVLLMKKYLENQFTIYTSSNGKAALDVVLNEDIDLIITDINMPKMTGIAFHNSLKERQKNIPVVFITTHLEDSEKSELLGSGAIDVIEKPFTKQTIIQLTQKLLLDPIVYEPAELLGQSVLEESGRYGGDFDDRIKAIVINAEDKFASQYCRVPIQTLLWGEKLKYDIYILITFGKFIKFFSKGDEISTIKRDERVSSKKIDSIYLLRDDFRNLEDANINGLRRLIEKYGGSSEVVYKFFSINKDIFFEQVKSYQVKEEVAFKAQAVLQEIIDEFERDEEIFLLFLRISTHDDWLLLHNLSVAYISLLIGVETGILNERQLVSLGKAALLHDVGIVEVDSRVLKKPRFKQSIDERKQFESHPIRGFELLREFSNLDSDVLLAVAQHHENIHGTGYPKRISGDKIHNFSKIIQVADEFSMNWKHSLSSDVDRSVAFAIDRIKKLYMNEMDLFAFACLLQVFRQPITFSYSRWKR